MASRQYERATGALLHTVAEVMRRYHSRLLEPTIAQSVTVETFLVFGPRNKDNDQTAPAIQVRGKEAYACIRITKLEERVAGRRDAVMWIDGDRWQAWPEATLTAIIDHELTHLELAEDPKTGEIQLDDAGRVKLKMRQHDFEVGWFDEIAERHAEASIEVMQAAILTTGPQMYFPGMEFVPLKRRRGA